MIHIDSWIGLAAKFVHHASDISLWLVSLLTLSHMTLSLKKGADYQPTRGRTGLGLAETGLLAQGVAIICEL